MRNKLLFICVMLLLALFGGCGQNQPAESKNALKEPGRMVCINNTLYYDTGAESTVEARCGMMDGKIEFSVAANQVPARHNESNFGTGYGYQFMSDSVEVLINNQFIVFAPKQQCEALQNVEPETDFELVVLESKVPQKTKILSTSELGLKDNYDVYYYGVDSAFVWIGQEKISLEIALKQGKLALDDLLGNLEAVCSYDDGGSMLFKDGGSRAYATDDFVVIKYNTLEGNRDLYIGCATMDIRVAEL